MPDRVPVSSTSEFFYVNGIERIICFRLHLSSVRCRAKREENSDTQKQHGGNIVAFGPKNRTFDGSFNALPSVMGSNPSFSNNFTKKYFVSKVHYRIRLRSARSFHRTN